MVDENSQPLCCCLLFGFDERRRPPTVSYDHLGLLTTYVTFTIRLLYYVYNVFNQWIAAIRHPYVCMVF